MRGSHNKLTSRSPTQEGDTGRAEATDKTRSKKQERAQENLKAKKQREEEEAALSRQHRNRDPPDNRTQQAKYRSTKEEQRRQGKSREETRKKKTPKMHVFLEVYPGQKSSNKNNIAKLSGFTVFLKHRQDNGCKNYKK